MKHKEVKLSDILRAARKHLEKDPHAEFVCLSISWCGVGTFAQKNTLTKWIEHDLLQLDKSLLCPTYDQWIEKHHPERYDIFRKMSCKQRADARLPWIDWMIQYWEEQGQ